MIDDAALREFYDANIDRYARATERLRAILKELLDDLSERYGMSKGYITGEPKSFESLARKLEREKYKDLTSAEECFDAVGDIGRARVVFPTLSDCESLLSLLRDQGAISVVEKSLENFIEEPSETGYRAIHVEVRVDCFIDGHPVAVPCELQIKTILQDAWGYYTHADFYKGGGVPSLVGDLMRDLSDLLHYTDRQANRLLAEVALSSPPPAVESAAGSGDAPTSQSSPPQSETDSASLNDSEATETKQDPDLPVVS